MQIVKKEYKIYEFKELSKEAQEAVIEKFNDINTDHEWYQFTYEDQMERLETMGYSDIEINFSGFWSQGDGASFTAHVDLEKWLKAHKLSSKYRALYNRANEFSCNIVRISSRYSHENTVDTDLNGYSESEKANTQADEVEKLILESTREEARAIYKMLETDYDYLTSREAIIDTIEANDWRFLADGTQF